MTETRATSAIRRSLVRFRNRLAPGIDFVYSSGYEFHLPHAPFDGLRGERVLTSLFHARRIRSDYLHDPAPASVRAIRRVHSDEYLDQLTQTDAVSQILGSEIDAETASRVLDVQREIVGGTLLAAAHALYSRGIAVNLNGGLHHAKPDGGAGFCVFNDIAVAIERQRAEGFRGRVLVVDLDLHDGDGTRLIYADDPDVFTFSIHNADWAPPEAVSSFSLTLDGEIEDAEYLHAIRTHLPGVVEAFRPDLVFYLAGVDPAHDDRIGNWKITPSGMLERDLFVLDTVRSSRRRGVPPALVILLAGGYGDEAWRYSARFLSALKDGKPVEPPTTDEVTLMHYRRLASHLRFEEEEQALDDWGLTEEDLMGVLDGATADRRLLGRYSRHEVELAMERLGFMDRIREKGFLHPILDFQPDGEGLTLYSDRERSEVLIELVMRRDRRTRSEREFLRVEWLLMQNPRKRFSRDRPRLPGQKYPGLGLLSDVASILIVACEQLELDGILFVPAHFHLAVQGRRILRCLEPEDQAFLDQLALILDSLPLGEAQQALDEGRIRTLDGDQAIEWRPIDLVVPTSRRLKRQFRDPDFKKRAQEAARDLRWVLTNAETAPKTQTTPAGTWRPHRT